MPGGYLYGFYTAPGGDPVPVKVACAADGNLKMSVENFDEKAVASWYNRKVTLSPGTYTDYDVTGISFIDLNTEEGHIYLKGLSNGTTGQIIIVRKSHHLSSVIVYNGNVTAAAADRIYTTSGTSETISGYKRMCFMLFYTGTFWQSMYLIFSSLDVFLEDPPTDGVTSKAATSNWSFDHNANVAAHHAKYTNLEAQTACNLNGDLYWSCPGNAFSAPNPDVNDVIRDITGIFTASGDSIHTICPVNLPNGATVTAAIVYGNAAAEAENWVLNRVIYSDGSCDEMATASIETEDTTITNPVINNLLYGYFLRTSSLDTNDEIWGALITYTL